MKILLTTDPEIPVPPPYYGGAERLANDLAREYAEHGHEVVLLSNKQSECEFTIKNIGWFKSSSVGLLNTIINAFQLLFITIRYNPDIIHSFSRLLYLYPVFFFTGTKVVKRYGRYIDNAATKRGLKYGGKNLSLVAAAEHMIHHLETKEKWYVIYNFVDVAYYQPDEKKERNYLLFLGRIEDIKGTFEAIEAARSADIPIKIAGNIQQGHEQYFETYVKPFINHKHIEYIGPVNNQQKRDLLNGAMALLFPIKWEEPFGIVMAESLAMGTPVIAFKRGSVPEVVKHGFNGFIVESNEEMIDAIHQLHSLDHEKIRSDAVERFSSKKAYNDYIALFNKMLQKR